MLRTFHPVGQGAFYSESFISFSIVYDCGSGTGRSAIEQELERTIGSIRPIEALFISHLDTDHVNGIEYLLNMERPKRIFLPMLEIEEKRMLLLQNALQAPRDLALEQLVWSPMSVPEIGAEAIPITMVLPSSETPYIAEPGPTYAIAVMPDEIPSGSRIKHFLQDDWVFVPFNYQSSTRSKKLTESLRALGLEFSSIEEFDVIWKDRTTRKKLRAAYRSLPGSENENSMALYSGPEQDYSKRYGTVCRSCYGLRCTSEGRLSRIGFRIRIGLRSIFKQHSFRWLFMCQLRRGCLYLGDFSAKRKQNFQEMRKAYGAYWGNIGVVQVPHHGSRRCFNPEIYEVSPKLCVISAGRCNRWGHPHPQTLAGILKKGGIVLRVTEDASTMVNFYI